MIAGHFFLAFSAVSLIAYLLGREGEEALVLGFAAGLFAFIPDIDIICAFKEIVAITSGFWNLSESFWEVSSQTHRGLTHSLFVSAVAASVFTIYCKIKSKAFAGVSLVLITGLVFALVDLVSAMITLAFILTGFVITDYFRNKVSLKDFALVSFFGLLSHPFGDIFTGVPPEFLYPLPISMISEKITLFQDPSINFLVVFGLELFLIWTGIFTFIYLKEKNLKEELSILSGLGLIFGAASFIITNPTLSEPYGFVFSILAFSGMISAGIWVFSSRERKYFYILVDFFSVLFFSYLSYVILFILLNGN